MPRAIYPISIPPGISVLSPCSISVLLCHPVAKTLWGLFSYNYCQKCKTIWSVYR